MSHGGPSERVQMTSLWNKKTTIAHELMYFDRICNSSNRFLTAKTETCLCTVHVCLFAISCLQVETTVHMLEWNRMLLLKSERPSCF